MSTGNYRVFSLSILLLLLLTSSLFAGTTGKITGKVTDKETGEPLFGVNVVVLGTTLGAATDMEGDFVILNVPPGTHNVKISMISYSSVTINNVRVRIDQTTPLSAELESEAIQTGDVVVVAEKSIIKRDVSTSVAAVEAAEMEALPVASVTEVVGLQAGVEEGLVVRGGSSDQLLLQMDGITLRDPRNNKPISSVALSSIQEVSIERGGFNAEYGQVRSGIVNIVSKSGSPTKYEGAIMVKYSDPQQKYSGISVYDANSMWNRPYLDDAVAWTGTNNGAWDEYERRQYPEFEGWNEVSKRLLSDNDPSNDLTPEGAKRVWEWERRRRPTVAPDYILDASFGGPIPGGQALGNLRFFASFRYEKEMLIIPQSSDDYNEYSGSVKLTSDVAPGANLMITTTFGKSNNVALNAGDAQFNNSQFGLTGTQFWNPTDYMRSPWHIAAMLGDQRASRIFTDSWYSQAEVNHFTIAGKYSDFINQNTFYDVSFEHVNRKYTTGPIRDRNTAQIYEVVPGYFVDEAPFGFSKFPMTGITGMFFGGHSSTMRDSSDISSYGVKLNLTSQINKEHMIKAGVDFSYYDLDLQYGEVNEFFSLINYVKQQWKPYRLSFYAQDKIEMLGFIANIGLRLDISNPNTEWADVDPFDESYFSGAYDPDGEYPTKKADVDYALSPRLGIAHPITDNSKLYFNFGHFKQMPAYEEVFRVGRSPAGNLQNYGDPTLNQAKTVSYELGYDHVLFGDYLLQIAAFYNDITLQQGYTQYVSDRKSIGYFQANNNNYQDTRGIEITFKKQYGNWIRGFVNYTYQLSTFGAFGKQTINEDPYQQKLIDQNTLVLYQQKPVPEPRANLSLTFFTPRAYGPEMGGLAPLSNWSLNFLGFWRAGEYISYNPSGKSQVVNNVQVTDYLNFDLRLNKTFSWDNFSILVYMEVRNLFNNKRLSGKSFYDAFDQQFYFESLHLPKSSDYDNIVGEDRIGEYRDRDVKFQPIEQTGDLASVDPVQGVIYYDRSTKQYMNYNDGEWSQVESGKMDQILEDKAYIDMPNDSTFDFLNPRQFYFGINLTFSL